mgnify:CR=1 FL=1
MRKGLNSIAKCAFVCPELHMSAQGFCLSLTLQQYDTGLWTHTTEWHHPTSFPSSGQTRLEEWLCVHFPMAPEILETT